MKFALITEGASEHRIIKHIIAKYFKDQEPDINQIQPKILNEKQETTGGWVEVLKYCEREELKSIMVENDYLVIQIDTDQSQNAPFDINHLKPTGKEKTPTELLKDVLDKLNSLILPEIKAAYSEKIFFAISIHTLECWLLPIYTSNHKSDIKGCFATLNKEIVKKNIKSISAAKNSPSSQQSYRSILSNWKRKKEIEDSAQCNAGFKFFVAGLGGILIES
jgi:hypothetical protein